MTREELARIASRYDTALSRAMLRACGALLVRTRQSENRTAPRRCGRFRGIGACMRNSHSPMDW